MHIIKRKVTPSSFDFKQINRLHLILKAVDKLKTKGVDLYNFCKLVVGNGNTIKFWHDKWYGDVCFKDKFHRRRPRSGIEESQFCELSSLLASVVLSNVEDRWSWSLSGHGEFSVKSAREVIDKHALITSSTPTRWSKVLSIKLNVFMWRMLLEKLPTRSNLAIRGLAVSCSLCLNCRMGVETRDHLFFVCPMALDLFRLLGRWCKKFNCNWVDWLKDPLNAIPCGLSSLKLPLHSCSLAGSTSAMKVLNSGGHLHFREVGEQNKSNSDHNKKIDEIRVNIRGNDEDNDMMVNKLGDKNNKMGDLNASYDDNSGFKTNKPDDNDSVSSNSNKEGLESDKECLEDDV
ncbi:RNA-directed DNA polymerase, eukaryota, reverse transcriptase zinc-binding domain protein [Tanacetum coccineum]|uniref:RNA-directed DNA polymerase, eukaryota, reverse transcriptase zinc-binding domain protein n=1 Tax=Tanacetum coccineum TaxID=301880 RepID=A0ABQ5CAY6_9ASTR